MNKVYLCLMDKFVKILVSHKNTVMQNDYAIYGGINYLNIFLVSRCEIRVNDLVLLDVCTYGNSRFFSGIPC